MSIPHHTVFCLKVQMGLSVLSMLFLSRKHRYEFAGVLLHLCGPPKELCIHSIIVLYQGYTFLENFPGYAA